MADANKSEVIIQFWLHLIGFAAVILSLICDEITSERKNAILDVIKTIYRETLTQNVYTFSLRTPTEADLLALSNFHSPFNFISHIFSECVSTNSEKKKCMQHQGKIHIKMDFKAEMFG